MYILVGLSFYEKVGLNCLNNNYVVPESNHMTCLGLVIGGNNMGRTYLKVFLLRHVFCGNFAFWN